MTVKELIEKLEQFDDDAEVTIFDSSDREDVVISHVFSYRWYKTQRVHIE